MDSQNTNIIAQLRQMEQRDRCRVLYAAESGSRAWGFPSPNSDYDIRFIYVHPLEWYLQLEKSKDTREWFVDELDFSGWELQKTLRLFAACNPTFNEQLNSPIVYESNDAIVNQLRDWIPLYFNPIKTTHHYVSIASHFLEPVNQNTPIGIKSLFYILRPLLAGLWTVRNRTMPPTAFSSLCNGISLESTIRSLIDELVVQKATALENHEISVPKEMNNWIRETSVQLREEAKNLPVGPQTGWEPLQTLFTKCVTDQENN